MARRFCWRRTIPGPIDRTCPRYRLGSNSNDSLIRKRKTNETSSNTRSGRPSDTPALLTSSLYEARDFSRGRFSYKFQIGRADSNQRKTCSLASLVARDFQGSNPSSPRVITHHIRSDTASWSLLDVREKYYGFGRIRTADLVLVRDAS